METTDKKNPHIQPDLPPGQLFDRQYTVLTAQVSPYRRYDGSTGKELMVTLTHSVPTAKPFSLRMDDIYLRTDNARTMLRIPVYEGELHYFLPNYKDYYYLPDEDMAIHKSVASFVDRKFRRAARPSNCYTRKSGLFLPQYDAIMEPEFRMGYQDKISYFELPDNFCGSDELLRRYIDHILEHMGAAL
jgi:hypothetical protein